MPSSTSQAAVRGAERARLDRESVVAAAIELLDSDGVEGLSARKLGAKLGSAATAIYWHVGSMDQLLGLAYDTAFGMVRVPNPVATPWREFLQDVAEQGRELFRSHPWLAMVTPPVPTSGNQALGMITAMLIVLEKAGLSRTDALDTVQTFVAAVRGFCAGEATWSLLRRRSGADEAELLAQWSRQQEAAFGPPDERSRELRQSPDDLDVEFDRTFTFGLRCYLDGLALRIEEAAAVARSE